MRIVRFLLVFCCLSSSPLCANPVNGLLERIDPGASKKFKIELVRSPDGIDFFELDQKRGKVIVRGNNYVSVATGINWYLKYYAGIHLSWNKMTASLPDKLPPVPVKERRETAKTSRYYLNYCTFSYSMAFWDWERWQQEIDWMALHGINLSLAITGTEAVWYRVLTRLGYSGEEINDFIAGPGFLAWWQMNNLEGWGGPNPDNWYIQQETLQRQIVGRMREYGIEPVLPGYAGMLPHNASRKLGVSVSDPGRWCGFQRPAFLLPTDARFNEIADLYYEEMTRLFGKANYYAIDPFHEGGSTRGVNLQETGKAILAAIKRVNPASTWVIQGWQANPRPEMIDPLPAGDLLVLDLFSEVRPMWGDKESSWYRENGFGKHHWIYCMLLNFGERPGLHGQMGQVIDGYYEALGHASGKTLQGVGATMEGIHNNPVMYELLFELPWRNKPFSKTEWLSSYVKARYGKNIPELDEAWHILGNTIYNPPRKSTQEGPAESVLCARPTLEYRSTSTWGSGKRFYNTDSVRLAAEKMLSVADQLSGNAHFEYDLIEVVRQTVSDKAQAVHQKIVRAYHENNKTEFLRYTQEFLALVLAQDSLLSTHPSFLLGNWLEAAKKLGQTQEEKQLYEWNARTQITTWGPREAADGGGLRDYAYKLWSGLLRDLYYPRWRAYFRFLEDNMDGKSPDTVDFFALEEAWTKQSNLYPVIPSGNAITRAREIFDRYIR